MRVRTLEVMVGIFILLGCLGLVFLAIEVSGLRLGAKPGGTYRVYARFDNIGGLTHRARVTMAGVTVGRVTSVKLDSQDYTARVEIAIEENYSAIPADTSAAILTSGILGEQYIGLIAGADEVYLADGGEIEDTQSALVLEDLVGRFLFNKLSE